MNRRAQYLADQEKSVLAGKESERKMALMKKNRKTLRIKTLGMKFEILQNDSLASSAKSEASGDHVRVLHIGKKMIVSTFTLPFHYVLLRFVVALLKYLVLATVSLIAVIPLVVCLFTSFKNDTEWISSSKIAPPIDWSYFDNYTSAWQKAGMGHAFLRSGIVLIIVLALSITMSAMLAYVLNRFRFRGNRLIRNLFMFAVLIPAIASQVSIYPMMAQLNLTGNLYGYIILLLGTDVISIYIFLQFFENLSPSLDESAILDGCTYFGVFFKILLPLTKPAIITCMILKGVSVYNEYYLANLYLGNEYVVSTALYAFQGPYKSSFNLICAGVLITMIPALLVFIFCQKQIYAGLGSDAVKG